MAKMVRPANVLASFLGMTKPVMIKEGNSYKCSLCKKTGDYASLVPHIQTHTRNVLTYKGVQIYRCGLDCCEVPHYHCCFCNKSVIIKICFIRHLKRCEEDCRDDIGNKQTWSSDQNSVKTTAPSRPLADAPAMGIVVQTPVGPALLQTVASPVRLQGTAAAPLVLQATHLPLGTSTSSPLLFQATTTTAASSPKQASTAKTSVEDTATTRTTTTATTSMSTLKNTSAMTSSHDEMPATPPSPSSPPQSPATASMELDTLIDATTDNPTSPPQDIAPLLSRLQPLLTNTSTRPTNRQGQASQPTNSAPPAGAIPPMSPPEASAPSKRRTKCPHCPTVLFKRNLKVHIFRHHKDVIPDASNTTPQQQQQRQQHQQKQQWRQPPQQKQRLMSICVDEKNGILAVQRHTRGLLAPVHVRKKVRAGQVVRCDLRECHQFQRMAVRHGLTVTSCQHTQHLEHCRETAVEEVLRSEVLDEMVALKQINDAKRAMCLRRQKMAQTAQVPFSVHVNFGGSPRHMFVSVHEPKTNDFCFGRLMVSFNIDRNMWHCPCTKPHISCFHKSIAKWHIFQTHRDLIEPSESSSCSKDASRTGKGKSTNRNSAKSAQGDIKRSVDYIYTQKKIPAELPEDLTNTVCEFPAHLFPVETTCEVCPRCPGLEESECITEQAKIVTMLGVADGVSTYMRRCPECHLIYRYQEWQDGLHNYDNHLILSTELCLYLRHSLLNQIPLPKAVKTLESLRGVQFPPAEELLNAYSHFEAMVSLEDTDSLNTEGSGSSPVLITELHRKAFLTLHWR